MPHRAAPGNSDSATRDRNAQTSSDWVLQPVLGCGVRCAASVRERTHHNKATCAPAKKHARIGYATLLSHQPLNKAPRLRHTAARRTC